VSHYRGSQEAWQQFARLQRPGNEVTGRVVAGGRGALQVELAPGIVGTLMYRHSFARPMDMRAFLLAHGQGDPIRVRIRRLDAQARHCQVQLADAMARLWICAADGNMRRC
jgi:hypothetical protein